MRDTAYPGWEAEVDGKPAPLLRVDYAFRGVAVPAGEHRVTLAYRPLSFRAGLALTLSAFLIVVALLTRRPAPARPRSG